MKINGERVINVVIAGLGGQGVIKASDVLADAAFLSHYDVKKAEVHGMSQRGGGVTSDVRFGPRVFSPMVPPGEADYLVVLAADQVEPNTGRLRKGGVLIAPDVVREDELPHRKAVNSALLGVLSRFLDDRIPADCWHQALRRQFKPELVEVNLAAFELGRRKGEALRAIQ
ncbi:2-oxoacid:acceptor oxidoreductase family protein [Thermopirellula anaerolimosa]